MAGRPGRAGRCTTPTRVGLQHIADRLDVYADRNGDESLRPAKLLRDLAKQGAGFASHAKAAA